MNKRFQIPGPTGGEMVCASAEAEDREAYKLLVGKTGRRWLVAANEPDAANYVYCEGGPNSEGFGGRTLTFRLEDGTSLDLQGPWHSNADSLFEETGYDCRNTYYTQGIISLSKDYDWSRGDLYKEVLHYDKKPVLGHYHRIEELAQKLANELGKTVHFGMRSKGGGTSAQKEPIK